MQNHIALEWEGTGTGFVKSMVRKDWGDLVDYRPHELATLCCCYWSREPIRGKLKSGRREGQGQALRCVRGRMLSFVTYKTCYYNMRSFRKQWKERGQVLWWKFTRLGLINPERGVQEHSSLAILAILCFKNHLTACLPYWAIRLRPFSAHLQHLTGFP